MGALQESALPMHLGLAIANGQNILCQPLAMIITIEVARNLSMLRSTWFNMLQHGSATCFTF